MRRYTDNELEVVINEVENSINLGEFKDHREYVMITIYFLWKMQTDSSMKTLDDLNARGFHNENIKFATYWCDDIYYYFCEEKEEWKKVCKMIGKYSDEILAECLLYIPFLNDEVYETIPEGVSILIDDLLDIKEERILEYNSKACDYTISSKARHLGCSYAALEDEYTLLTIGSIRSDVLGYKNVTFNCEYDEEVKYDRVLSNTMIDPTFSEHCGLFDVRDVWEEFPKESTKAWNDCGLAFWLTKENGKTIALMHGGQLTVKQTETVRKFMCEEGYIESVIMLPDKMYSNTWINPFLVVLSRENKSVRFIDARNEFVANRVKGKRNNTLSEKNIQNIVKSYRTGENAFEVNIDDIRQNEYILNPLRYKKSVRNEVKTVELGELLVDVKRGMSLSASEMDALISDEPSGLPCILPSGIKDGVVTSNLYYHGDVKKSGKNEANYCSLLLGKTGTPFRAALTTKNYMIVGNLYILEMQTNMKISPEYVCCFLNSNQGQNEIRKYAVGPTTPIISIANVKKIEIPIFDEKKQAEINERSKEIIEEFNKCYKQISETKQEIDSIFDMEG